MPFLATVMKIKKLKIIISFCFVVFLIVNIPLSSAIVESHNQPSKSKVISIIGCQLNRGSCFSPCQVTILKGDTITWINQDTIVHIVASGSGNHGPDGWFSSSFIQPQQTFSHKFDRIGSFVYFDILHPYTEGVVIVGSTADFSYVHLAKSFFSNWCNH